MNLERLSKGSVRIGTGPTRRGKVYILLVVSCYFLNANYGNTVRRNRNIFVDKRNGDSDKRRRKKQYLVHYGIEESCKLVI